MRYKPMMAGLAVAGLLTTGLGFAQSQTATRQAGERRAEQGMRGPSRGLAKLDLTEEQRQQLQELGQAERQAGGALAAKMPELQRQLHEAIFTGSGDVAAIAQQIVDLHEQILQARIAHQQKVAAILTAEQRAEMAKMAPRGPGRPGGRRPPFPPGNVR